MSPVRAAGFTLIELIIGLALMGLIVTLLFGGLRLVSHGSDAAEEAGERAGQMRIVHSLVRRELAAIYPYRWKKTSDMRLAFVGGPAGIRFVSSTPPRVGQGGLQLVGLLVSPGKDGLRLIMRRQIADREQRDFAGLESGAGPDAGDSAVLLDGLESAAFQYFGSDSAAGKPSWRDKWEDPQRLPRLVRLALRSKGVPPWPDVVVELQVGEVAGCPAWDAVNERCWG